MFDHTIPPVLRSLGALSRILDKAQAHCDSHNIDHAVLIGDRLAPDMLNFARQVQLTCDFSARMAARLAGRDVPSYPDVETTFDELRDRIAAVRDYLRTFDAANFDGAETREITIKNRFGDLQMTGLDFGRHFALPQVYFHYATAYNILRHNGVPLGKLDFMGAT